MTKAKEDVFTPNGKKIGRPKKTKLVENNTRGRKQLGRPKGDAQIMNDYKARMLASPKSEKVLQAVFDVALNHDHKHQAACMKMVLDRIAPVGAFEQDVVKGGGRSAIEINITGLGATVTKQTEPLDAEFTEITD